MDKHTALVNLEGIVNKYDETLLADANGNYKSTGSVSEIMLKVWKKMNEEDKGELSHIILETKSSGGISSILDEISNSQK